MNFLKNQESKSVHALADLVSLLERVASDTASECSSIDPGALASKLPAEAEDAARRAVDASLELQGYLKRFTTSPASCVPSSRVSSELPKRAARVRRSCRSASPVVQRKSGVAQRAKGWERCSTSDPQTITALTSLRTHLSLKTNDCDSVCPSSSSHPINRPAAFVTATRAAAQVKTGGHSKRSFITDADLSALRLFSQASLTHQHAVKPHSSPSQVESEPSSTNAAIPKPVHHFYDYNDFFFSEEEETDEDVVPISGSSFSTGFYASLKHQEMLEAERRHVAVRRNERLAKERTALGLSLCMPFLTPQERVTKIAPLSQDCYRAAMSDFPVLSVDFCSLDTEDDLMWLPVRRLMQSEPTHIVQAFIRHMTPKLAKSLQSARMNCTEHLLLSGAVGTPLREFSLTNVPVSIGGSSLLSTQLQDAASAAAKLLDNHSAPEDVIAAASTLAPLRPLSGWLHALACRCANLTFLSVQFNPELPFSVSCGLPPHHTLPPALSASSRPTQSVYPPSCSRIAALFFKGFAQYLLPRQDGSHHLLETVQFRELPPVIGSQCLRFRALTTLELLQVASPLPLTLFLGAAFPQLSSLVISTTVSFSTVNLAEFLSLLGLLVLDRCHEPQTLQALAIHHASNIANARLLESLLVFQDLKSLRLTSSSAFGSHVVLTHPTVVYLEISYHEQLSWVFELPRLKHLKLLTLKSEDDPVIALHLPQLLASVAARCPDLKEVEVLGPGYKSLLHLKGKQVIADMAQGSLAGQQ